jgi:hypothetical protein
MTSHAHVRADATVGLGLRDGKHARSISEDDKAALDQERDFQLTINEELQNQPRRRGQTGAAVESHRTHPSNQTQPTSDQRMVRRLPEAESVRTPVSARQVDERNRLKREAQSAMPNTQYKALSRVVSDDGNERFRRFQAKLIRHVGDVQNFPNVPDPKTGQRKEDPDVAKIRTLDRAIQTAEQHSGGRGHVIYVNGEMPPQVNRSNCHAYVPSTFHPGDRVNFDGFTSGHHNMHELDEFNNRPDRTVVYEIRTKRGAYVGASSKSDNTSHIMPRGVEFRIVGTQLTQYKQTDGSTGQRWVVQLQDTGRR